MTTSRKTGIFWTSNPFADQAAVLVASGLGLGRIPYLPDAAGSLGGLFLAWLTADLAGWLQILLFLLFLLLSIGVSERAEQLSKTVEPNFIVVDEMVGMWATMLFLWRFDAVSMFLGFLLFRIFDRLKFFPLNLFQGFRGGLGIVMDDLAAGMLANTILRLMLLSGLAFAGIG